MLGKRIISHILNVKKTVIESVKILTCGSIQIDVRPTKGQVHRCGVCGRKAKFYDNGRGRRRWRSNDLGRNKVYLNAKAPRVCCKEHGVVVAKVPWARHDSLFTYDFEQTIAWLSLYCSKKAISEFMRISWNTIGPIISRIKGALDPHPEKRFDNLIRIGIDETSYRKGHKYLTVVVNHDTGKVIWVCKGHGKTVLEGFFKCLTKQQCDNIELVSADGAKWISTCIEKYCKNAERCVDPFHVVTWAIDILDQIRAEAWNGAKSKSKAQPRRKRGRPPKDAPPKDTTASDIKGAKYALGKNPENLTQNQAAKLEMIAKSDKRLHRAYLLKESLRLIFQMELEEARDELDCWIKWAQRSRIPQFVELQRKIRRHYDAILGSIQNNLSNARIEAINNKIKLSIRMAYGFRNIQNMLDMIMLRCSDIQVNLPWQMGAA